MTIKTPVQIFINNKFFCIANAVEIKENSPKFKRGLIPDNKIDLNQFTGTIVNIKKPPRTSDELKELTKEKNKKGYDAFYQEMINKVDDPKAHLPVI